MTGPSVAAPEHGTKAIVSHDKEQIGRSPQLQGEIWKCGGKRIAPRCCLHDPPDPEEEPMSIISRKNISTSASARMRPVLSEGSWRRHLD